MGRIDAVFSAAVGRHGGVRPWDSEKWACSWRPLPGPSEALACALDVQRELRANNLSCLRAGLHTGEAQVRDEVRYFGQAVARTARLRDLGHVGQVLVSRASADLVAEHLPAGASLIDLGPHRMADLSRPVHVYQLCHPDLRSGFPPLRSLDRHPHNLPLQLTNFVGREAALAEVGGLLADHGLVTITGSGGCGKTRLALQVAAEPWGRGRAKRGSWTCRPWPTLTSSPAPSWPPWACGRSAARPTPDADEPARRPGRPGRAGQLRARAGCRRGAGRGAGAALWAPGRAGHLPRTAGSSRARSYRRVPAFPCPRSRTRVGIEALDASEAVQLFKDRARAARPNFAITDDNAAGGGRHLPAPGRDPAGDRAGRRPCA